MPPSEADRYRLTPAALTDLDDIWRYSAETWSAAQADRYLDELVRVFEMIASVPTLAREHREFNPPVRIHAYQSHLIIYTHAGDHVAILRLLGGRQDWLAILKAADI
ncbi:type II toxin-antitoxin system RelE/ParE family toxin [Inquilinus sp. Marseille-Q2685]|uniref:type II toxin-antitoxin system RelE/ParE family toxin n=1 Tax=Inquilinus sp. Marseille-Q2685 TaxID=2866581 RepID=UPI001CE42806|nr:type II toxin-antitoxin system RelE/ParE family toxin [Inquilinus sp. Marseille-Q2685]